MIDYRERLNKLFWEKSKIIEKNTAFCLTIPEKIMKIGVSEVRLERLTKSLTAQIESVKALEEERNNLENTLLQRLEKVNQNKSSTIKNDDVIPRCEICLELYDHNLNWHSCIVICGHQFGKSCLEKVLETSGRCPKCNKVFTADNIITLF